MAGPEGSWRKSPETLWFFCLRAFPRGEAPVGRGGWRRREARRRSAKAATSSGSGFWGAGTRGAGGRRGEVRGRRGGGIGAIPLTRSF